MSKVTKLMLKEKEHSSMTLNMYIRNAMATIYIAKLKKKNIKLSGRGLKMYVVKTHGILLDC